MAKLVKIKDVMLYTGLTNGAADCVEALKQLKEAGIKFALLSYNDQVEQHKANFEALSTWTFGAGDSTYQKVFTDYPIMTWDECYDDWSTQRHAAHGLTEIQQSSLLVYNREAAEKAD